MDRVLHRLYYHIRDSVSLVLGVQCVFLRTGDSENLYKGSGGYPAAEWKSLRIPRLPYFLCGIMDLFPGALRGMGHSAVPMILSVIGTVGTRIVWIFGIFPISQISVYSVYFLSGILDPDDRDAGDLFLFCEEKGTQ